MQACPGGGQTVNVAKGKVGCGRSWGVRRSGAGGEGRGWQWPVAMEAMSGTSRDAGKRRKGVAGTSRVWEGDE